MVGTNCKSERSHPSMPFQYQQIPITSIVNEKDTSRTNLHLGVEQEEKGCYMEEIGVSVQPLIVDACQKLGSLDYEQHVFDEMPTSEETYLTRGKVDATGCNSNMSSVDREYLEAQEKANELELELETVARALIDSISQNMKLREELSLTKEVLCDTTKKFEELELDHKELQEQEKSIGKLREENDDLVTQVMDLQVEVKSLFGKKSKLEDHISSINSENNLLKEEEGSLLLKISELENSLAKKVKEHQALQKRIEDEQNDTSAQIVDLTDKVNKSGQQIKSLQTEKDQLFLVIERGKEESTQTLAQAENQNKELSAEIVDREIKLKEKEDAFRKLGEEHKQLEGLLQEYKENLKLAEMKIEDLTQEYQKNLKDQKIDEHGLLHLIGSEGSLGWWTSEEELTMAYLEMKIEQYGPSGEEKECTISELTIGAWQYTNLQSHELYHSHKHHPSITSMEAGVLDLSAKFFNTSVEIIVEDARYVAFNFETVEEKVPCYMLPVFPLGSEYPIKIADGLQGMCIILWDRREEASNLLKDDSTSSEEEWSFVQEALQLLIFANFLTSRSSIFEASLEASHTKLSTSFSFTVMGSRVDPNQQSVVNDELLVGTCIERCSIQTSDNLEINIGGNGYLGGPLMIENEETSHDIIQLLAPMVKMYGYVYTRLKGFIVQNGYAWSYNFYCDETKWNALRNGWWLLYGQVTKHRIGPHEIIFYVLKACVTTDVNKEACLQVESKKIKSGIAPVDHFMELVTVGAIVHMLTLANIMKYYKLVDANFVYKKGRVHKS